MTRNQQFRALFRGGAPFVCMGAFDAITAKLAEASDALATALISYSAVGMGLWDMLSFYADPTKGDAQTAANAAARSAVRSNRMPAIAPIRPPANGTVAKVAGKQGTVKLEQRKGNPKVVGPFPTYEPKKQPKKEEPPLKFDTTDRIREQLAQEQRALAAEAAERHRSTSYDAKVAEMLAGFETQRLQRESGAESDREGQQVVRAFAHGQPYWKGAA